MIIDVHCHFGSWPFAMDNFGVDRIKEYLDRFNVVKAIFSSSKAIVYDFKEGNKELIEFLKKDNRLYGYLVLNPNYLEDSIEEVNRYLDNKRIVGIKLHPAYSRVSIDDERTKRIIEEFLDTRLIYLVHTWGISMAVQLARVARQFPNVRFIMGHTGGDVWYDCLDIVKPYPNIYVEPCSSYADRDKVRVSIDTIGIERVLFGTDFTLINPSFVIGMVECSGLTEEEKSSIYYKNSIKLLEGGKDA
ncbi:MAG: amidohydrolase family protein [bacterium]|nr:amidohydrolase family protein [bacterium]